jgi:hypothetical protein
MLVFYSVPYVLWEILAVISIVFLTECYLFAKWGVKIKDKKLMFKVISLVVIFLFFGNKFLLSFLKVI